jgi:hypothetical protein
MKIEQFSGMRNWASNPSYLKTRNGKIWTCTDDDTLNTLVALRADRSDDDLDYPLLDLLDEHHFYVVDDPLVIIDDSEVSIGDRWVVHVARNMEWFDGASDDSAWPDAISLVSTEGMSFHSIVNDDDSVSIVFDSD